MRNIILLCLVAVGAFGQAVIASKPTVLMNPTPPPVTGATITVCASMCTYTTLQAAVNAAARGDEIVLTAGQTFTGTTVLPVKAGSGTITIRTSNMGGIPAFGTRNTGSAYAAAMPTLNVNTNSVYVIQNDYTNVTVSARAANDYYFIGLNITLDAAVKTNFGLIGLSDGGDPAGAPQRITFDRCWIHTDHLATLAASETFVRGVLFSGSNVAFVGNTVEGFSDPTSGSDSQAILIFGGPGPALLKNNHLSAASEPILLGGTNSGAIGAGVADVEIAFNFVDKPAAFGAGMGTNSKNCLELKTGVRVWIHDFVHADCYSNTSQTGAGILDMNSPSQSGPWNAASDHLIEYGIIRHAGQAAQIIAAVDPFCWDANSTVNTSGTTVTITAGTAFTANTAITGSTYVQILGTIYTIVVGSVNVAMQTATLSSSPGTHTGVAMTAPYPCTHMTRLTFRQVLADDIDTSYSSGDSGSSILIGQIPYTTVDHVTVVAGTETPSAGFSGQLQYGTPASGLFQNLATTNSIFTGVAHGAQADGFANAINTWLTAPYTTGSTYTLLTNNIVSDAGTEVTDYWNMVSNTNFGAANLAAVGLLSNHKALDPSSTYIATGAGANVLCVDETAITNGTPAVACGFIPGRIAASARIYGPSR